MKTGMKESCLRTVRAGVLSVLACALALAPGCGSSGEFAQAGAGVTAGMMGAGMGMELARDLLFKGIEGVDRGKSNASLLPSASAELSKARKVAVLLEKPGEVRMPSGGFMEGDRDIVEDSLTGLLMQAGYEVASSDLLASAMKEDAPDRLKVLRSFGVELLIGGAVVSGMDHDMRMGLFLGSAESHMKSVVDTASLRITACGDGRVLMTATITYRKGKPAPDAARDLAGIIERARHGLNP